jgi:hypothetical protein
MAFYFSRLSIQMVHSLTCALASWFEDPSLTSATTGCLFDDIIMTVGNVQVFILVSCSD